MPVRDNGHIAENRYDHSIDKCRVFLKVSLADPGLAAARTRLDGLIIIDEIWAERRVASCEPVSYNDSMRTHFLNCQKQRKPLTP
jgi:hypothetical protein